MIKGCDISNWQASTPSGYEFYIIKATEGNGYKDPRMKEHIENVKRMGKSYGFYHYARPDLGNSAEAEAKYFLSIVKPYINSAVLALDFECKNYQNYVAWAKQWLEYVYKQTGARPLFYVPGLYAKNFITICKETNTGVWAPSNSSYYNGMTVVMTQETINKLDIDYFYGDINQFKKYGVTKNVAENVSRETKKSNEEVANEVIAGKWGNGNDRKIKLANAGYNYSDIQKIVNTLLSENSPVYHTIKGGENLTIIAKQYGTSVNNLVKMNNIKNPNLIYAGQRIRVK